MRGAALLLACVVAMSAACSTPGPSRGAPSLVTRERVAMGSALQLTAWTADEARAVEAFDAVFAEFERLDALMSVWRRGSDVERLNDAAGLGPVAVSAEVMEVLAAARQVSEWTGGKFDVTFGALSGLWRFDHDQDNQIPSPEAVAARLGDVGYEGLQLDTRAGTARLMRRGMRAHLGGIGKGYAIDRATAILRARGFNDVMIQSGGDLFVSGLRDGRPWRLGIQDPRGTAGRTFATVDLSNRTLSTSGDYERFFMKGGVRYHHLLDPDSGQPARGCRSVTIVAGSATLADALSTGVFVSGPQAGLALIERLPDVEGVIVTAQNQVLVSSGLQGRLVLTAPPTDAP